MILVLMIICVRTKEKRALRNPSHLFSRFESSFNEIFVNDRLRTGHCILIRILTAFDKNHVGLLHKVNEIWPAEKLIMAFGDGVPCYGAI